MAEKITFGVFADLHYKKGMYLSSVKDLEDITSAAAQSNAAFVVSLGDMCNDYLRSPEIVKSYLNNKEGLAVFGIYGNHELESSGNDMATVTPCLTNRPNEVIWGTNDKGLGDGSIGYYYFDKGAFRFIALDTNYSFNLTNEKYEHNRPASWGAPSENLYHDSLGDIQLEWLKSTVLDAANTDKHCVILSHATFCPEWECSPDGDAVCKIFREANAIKKNTVILALNGHWHDNRQAMVEDVVYIDVNTVRNGYWQEKKYFPYAEEDPNAPKYTFEYISYDESGEETGRELRALESLRMSTRTLYFDSPLYAIVTVSENGNVELRGSSTNWIYGVKPEGIDIPERLLRIDDFKK